MHPSPDNTRTNTHTFYISVDRASSLISLQDSHFKERLSTDTFATLIAETFSSTTADCSAASQTAALLPNGALPCSCPASSSLRKRTSEALYTYGLRTSLDSLYHLPGASALPRCSRSDDALRPAECSTLPLASKFADR